MQHHSILPRLSKIFNSCCVSSLLRTIIKFKSFFTRSRHRRRDFKTWRSSSRSERCFGRRNDAIWSRRALEKCANRFLRHSGKLLRHIIRLQCFDPQKNMASVRQRIRFKLLPTIAKFEIFTCLECTTLQSFDWGQLKLFFCRWGFWAVVVWVSKMDCT